MLSFIISKPSPLKSLYSNKGKKLIDIITAKIIQKFSSLPSITTATKRTKSKYIKANSSIRHFAFFDISGYDGPVVLLILIIFEILVSYKTASVFLEYRVISSFLKHI